MLAHDDHEVTNDFAGGADPASDPRFQNVGAYINETPLFDNGLRTFEEWHPIGEERYGDTGDPLNAFKRSLPQTLVRQRRRDPHPRRIGVPGLPVRSMSLHDRVYGTPGSPLGSGVELMPPLAVPLAQVNLRRPARELRPHSPSRDEASSPPRTAPLDPEQQFAPLPQSGSYSFAWCELEGLVMTRLPIPRRPGAVLSPRLRVGDS